MEEHTLSLESLPAKSRNVKQKTIIIPIVSSANTWCNYPNILCVEMQYLCSHLSNVIQPVHHVVQQLQLLLCQFAQIQGSRSTAGLDDTGNILQAPTSLLSVLTALKQFHAINVTFSQSGSSSQATVLTEGRTLTSSSLLLLLLTTGMHRWIQQMKIFGLEVHTSTIVLYVKCNSAASMVYKAVPAVSYSDSNPGSPHSQCSQGPSNETSVLCVLELHH